MTHYASTFDTDWDELDMEAAALHAYAIGVAAVMGEDNRDHLKRLFDELQTGYERSVVELAYEEGRTDAQGVERTGNAWNRLVTKDESTSPSTPAERDAPDLIDRAAMLERMHLDSTSAMDLPEFLRR